jgi:hypothetical protein
LRPARAASRIVVSRPSSIACSNAKKLVANTSAGLQAKNTSRRSQRLVHARRMPVVAITPMAEEGPSRAPDQGR